MKNKATGELKLNDPPVKVELYGQSKEFFFVYYWKGFLSSYKQRGVHLLHTKNKRAHWFLVKCIFVMQGKGSEYFSN